MKLKRISKGSDFACYVVDESYDKILNVWIDSVVFIEHFIDYSSTHYFDNFDDFDNWYDKRSK